MLKSRCDIFYEEVIKSCLHLIPHPMRRCRCKYPKQPLGVTVVALEIHLSVLYHFLNKVTQLGQFMSRPISWLKVQPSVTNFYVLLLDTQCKL